MTAAGLSAAELHGLVDGFLEPERRADVLRRLAGCPTDLARVEAWQEQGDILRNAFGGIALEPLPAALNLAPLFQTETGLAPRSASSARKSRVKVTTAAILLSAAVGGFWLTWAGPSPIPERADGTVRRMVDATLAERATTALADGAMPQASRDKGSMIRIPDLEAAGFSLIAADAPAALQGALVFHYRNRHAERLVMVVTRADSARETPPKLIGETYIWHHGKTAFALAGSLKPERLLEVSASLRDGADAD